MGTMRDRGVGYGCHDGGAVAEGREECGAEAKGLAGGAGRAGAEDRGARAVIGVVGQWG